MLYFVRYFSRETSLGARLHLEWLQVKSVVHLQEIKLKKQKSSAKKYCCPGYMLSITMQKERKKKIGECSELSMSFICIMQHGQLWLPHELLLRACSSGGGSYHGAWRSAVVWLTFSTNTQQHRENRQHSDNMLWGPYCYCRWLMLAVSWVGQ